MRVLIETRLRSRSHFWMALLEGKKRWLLYPKEDAPLLYPIWPEGCHDPVFEADVEAPNAVRHPAALLARGYRCVLEAGACGLGLDWFCGLVGVVNVVSKRRKIQALGIVIGFVLFWTLL